jgi:hypothetical protein
MVGRCALDKRTELSEERNDAGKGAAAALFTVGMVHAAGAERVRLAQRDAGYDPIRFRLLRNVVDLSRIAAVVPEYERLSGKRGLLSLLHLDSESRHVDTCDSHGINSGRVRRACG